jgi:cell division protein FtsB
MTEDTRTPKELKTENENLREQVKELEDQNEQLQDAINNAGDALRHHY